MHNQIYLLFSSLIKSATYQSGSHLEAGLIKSAISQSFIHPDTSYTTSRKNSHRKFRFTELNKKFLLGLRHCLPVSYSDSSTVTLQFLSLYYMESIVCVCLNRDVFQTVE